ncbi:lipid A export permease/ATP-binding protein MsbA [Methylophilus aquaticus]|uniref:Lipid A export permease/ATP-binding protein MsbA n=1 Tax=Methylophilus aquaticus TaxID=1971610 RepID=A0ABT9JV33_9PROT|nr:lipid A export permease/ATP-binding protein MsbA [Methylophilus aquaticus]MDP8567970.1 lipid A export permease/ATP-binding protein MsbA [Methylophilus aquaticus]
MNNMQGAYVQLARLMAYIKPYWLTFVMALICLMILSASNTAFLSTIKQVTDKGFVGQAQYDSRIYLTAMLCGLLFARALAGFGSNYLMRIVGRRVIEDIRNHVFGHMLTLPASFFDQYAIANITTKITFDCEQLYSAVTKVIISSIRDSLTIVGIVAYMLYLDWKLTLVFLMVMPIIARYLKRMAPKLRNSGKQVQASMSDMTQVIEEAASGQRVVKIFNGEFYEYQRFSNIAAKNRQMMVRLGRISGLNSMFVEMLAAVALGMVIYYSAGQFTAGEFAAFIGALLMLIGPVKAMASVNEDVQIAVTACQSVFAVLDASAEMNQGELLLTQPIQEIRLQNVTFKYPFGQSAALSNFNLTIQAGESVALVGMSGGGKSTLVNLLPRFHEIEQGRITINGIDIQQLALPHLRQQFALVSQDTVLFNDTIYHNIAYGSLHAVSREAVVAAAKAAYAWEFIEKLPQQLDTHIGDRGLRLSGGQRQRLSIARAMLKNAPVLILDEATSALDNESENKVQAALKQLMVGKTTIMIAHRLTTIQHASRIVVMDQGRIIEEGVHEQLAQSGGKYATLYNMHGIGK